ncbi:DinB family protein [Sporosarcina sp. GW1-11]|uniref:DinB family protein n=1 Tax=Sporosarcina sp. GW1-11 TaxID=2899126 RepID=UPI00294E042D|nr:DinB family protein [Sporosarcina sp. GW1-11]MDV6379102.1 DinB family protein [Sporosarcina sp. GW1-11]
MGAIQQLSMARGYTLGRIKGVSEDAWDVQPAGFSNTIRWNVGHIYVTVESLLSRAIQAYEKNHSDWSEFFAPGSSPAAWQSTPPTTEELVGALKEQGERVSQLMESSPVQALESPLAIGKLITLETVEDVLRFLAWHEGIHSGLINGLTRVIK